MTILDQSETSIQVTWSFLVQDPNNEEDDDDNTDCDEQNDLEEDGRGKNQSQASIHVTWPELTI